MLEFDAGVLGGEVPVWPWCDWALRSCSQAAISSIRVCLSGMRRSRHWDGEDAEFGLGQIEPTAVLWRIVPFEALDQPPGFGGRERLVERRLAVDVEIVLDQHDGLGVREVDDRPSPSRREHSPRRYGDP